MSDEPFFPELSRRQQEILSLVVQAYTETPEPVSSRTLVEKQGLDVSTATVRNEMAHLEEMGYLIAPHTSAGRIPTTLGYRYFVRNLMQKPELGLSERHQIDHRFKTLPLVLEQWLNQAATTLARTAQSASLVTPPTTGTSRFKHIELIAIQGRLALMVLVLQGGIVHQRMLNLADTLSQNVLSETANRLNSLLANMTVIEVRVKSHGLNVLEREVGDIAAELMTQGDLHNLPALYRDGLSEIINTFPAGDGVQQAVRLFEERAFLDMVLSQMLPGAQDDVQVVIAGEGRWGELSQVSMVLSHYGVPGQMSGTLGVLGPTHINYTRAISAVRHIARLMTEMLGTLYHDGGDSPDSSHSNRG